MDPMLTASGFQVTRSQQPLDVNLDLHRCEKVWTSPDYVREGSDKMGRSSDGLCMDRVIIDDAEIRGGKK